jgi:endo-1,4-beta-xylanase
LQQALDIKKQNYMNERRLCMKKRLMKITATVLTAALTCVFFACNLETEIDKPTDKRFTVTFNANEGKFADDASKKFIETNIDGTLNFPTEEPTRNGYAFNGWYPNAAGSGSQANSATTVTQHAAFYAKWTAETPAGQFTVTFNANQGKFTDNTATKTVETNIDGTVNIPAEEPTRNGYTFNGWYPNADGSGSQASAATTVTQDTAFYAKWTAETSSGTPVTSWQGLGAPNQTTALKYDALQGKTDVLKIAPNTAYDWAVLTYSLDAYRGQTVTITVSMQVWLDAAAKIAWQVNNSSYTTIAGSTDNPYTTTGQWFTITGSREAAIPNEAGKVLYLSGEQLGSAVACFANFSVTINGGSSGGDVTALHSKWPFPLGAAAPASAFTSSNGQYPLLKHFKVLVAENDMKPESIMPSTTVSNWNNPGYRWTNADKLVTYAEQNSTAIRGHVLIWHSQTPAWFFQGGGTGGRATKTQLYERMENHIKTVMQKYGSKIGSWDVCNEVVGDSGGPRPAGDPASGGSRYTQIMEDAGLSGMNKYEYVLKAFQWARQYADANGGQNVKLYLTDYNIEYSGAKQNEFYNLAQWLKQQNAPIDGVGFQAHIKWDWPSVSEIGSALDRLAGLGLKVQVTEMDISLFSYSGEDTTNKKTLTESERNTRLAAQAQKYRDLFDMFRQKYNNGAGPLTMVLVWGIADGESWLNNHPVQGRTDYPLLFDRSYQPKAAFQKLAE